jgi:hypothetical protein
LLLVVTDKKADAYKRLNTTISLYPHSNQNDYLKPTTSPLGASSRNTIEHALFSADYAHRLLPIYDLREKEIRARKSMADLTPSRGSLRPVRFGGAVGCVPPLKPMPFHDPLDRDEAAALDSISDGNRLEI